MADRAQIKPGSVEITAEGGGGIKSLLPLVATLILMPAVAWAMTTFVLLPKLQKSLGATPAESQPAPETAGGHGTTPTEKEHGGEAGGKETVTMGKLLVNVSGTLGSRYLLTSLTLSGASADFKSKMEKNDAKLRDMACTILATKTINELEKPGARSLVRSELLTGFNNVLGGNSVREIYITEFAIQ